MRRGKRIVRFFKRNWVTLLIILLLAVLFIYSYFSKGIVYSISNSDGESIINFVNSFGIFSYVMFVFLVIIEVVLAPIPALALYVAGGALFGTFFGGILTLAGNIIGAYIAFWIARKFGRNFVEKRTDERMRKKFDNFSEKYGVFSLFLLRVNPFTTSDLFSYLAGLTNMKVRDFLLGTGLGLTPMIFIQAYLGQAFVKNHPILYSVLIWISIVYLLMFLYLIWKAASVNKKKAALEKKEN